MLLDVKNLSVRFGEKTVVNAINFHMRAGEKLALVGESGSGKTITALSLLRLVADAQTSGVAQFAGRDLLRLNEREMQALRGQEIAMIFQEPMTALNPLFSIGNQIAEVLQLKQGLTGQQCADAAVELLASTGIPEPKRRANSFPHQLSGGQRQRAMIAMALACRPKLLLADEPTTALDVSVRSQILDLLSDLQRQTGMAVLMITHDLNLVRRFADRVAVMEQGHIVETGNVTDVFATPQHAYTRKLLDSVPQRHVSGVVGEQVLIKTDKLAVHYPVPIAGVRGWFNKGQFTAVHAATLQLRQGECLGIIGESGSGKSSLAQALLGLNPCQGELQILGQRWGNGGDKTIRHRVQAVFQDPFSSLSPRMTVDEIVGEGLIVHAPQLTVTERRARVIQTLQEVGLTEAEFPGLLQRYPHAFSGGQRQRLAIARALIIEPQVLVLDEPTSALDVTIQQQVLRLLQGLQRSRGLAYVLITHDVAVIRAMAHTVMVMQDGQVLETGPVERVLDKPEHAYTRMLMTEAG